MIWIAMILAGITTFASRFSFICCLSGHNLPPTAKSLLNYVSTAVLTAIIASNVLIVDEQLALADNAKIPAFLLAAVVAAATRNVVLTILTGLGFHWLFNHGALPGW